MTHALRHGISACVSVKLIVMVQNKNQGQQGLKDQRQGAQDEQNKKQLRETPQDEQNDTSRKGDKTTQSRRDNHGRKQ